MRRLALAVLGVMILVLMAGMAMSLLADEAPFDAWALASPLPLLALPSMAIVAAPAVLFETVGWLRGGLGNVIYLFLFTMAIIPAIVIPTYPLLFDRTGLRLAGEGIRQAAQLVHRMSEEGFILRIVGNLSALQRFWYDGIDWTASVA